MSLLIKYRVIFQLNLLVSQTYDIHFRFILCSEILVGVTPFCQHSIQRLNTKFFIHGYNWWRLLLVVPWLFVLLIPLLRRIRTVSEYLAERAGIPAAFADNLVITVIITVTEDFGEGLNIEKRKEVGNWVSFLVDRQMNINNLLLPL